MKNKSLSLLVMFCGLIAQVWAQKHEHANSPWKDIQEISLPYTGKEAPQLPEKFRLLELNTEQISNSLSMLHPDFSARTSDKTKMEIELPLPDGGWETFEIYSDPIMHPDLARQYPEIQTFAGQSKSDPTATIRLDLSPHGFNAQILTDNRGSVYIAPVTVGDNRYHISYFKKDARKPEDWQCLTEAFSHDNLLQNPTGKIQAGTCGIRREYRLALACTGEYATFHGGTAALALAAMNTTMNRVNGVYEREVSVRMNMIANNNLLVYTDGTTDPYTNGNAGAMIGENQTNIDAVIGSANYDIGHVVGTASGGSGLASLGVVCSGSKARGVTGRSSPIGDAFDIDYVAHEMGHQFGANHTFNDNANGSCAGNLAAGQAFEPGSGTTIMAYAGICGGVDVQLNSNDYFHAISLQEIENFTQTGGGNGCPTTIPVANNAPNVNAGADFTIPANTPFKLTASGSDPDGNAVRYCWEQMDNQLITHPPASTVTGGPVFRSFSPSVSPTRFFPSLPAILSGANTAAWEVIPSVSRTLNFRVTGRDFAPGGGCTDEDDMVVTVAGNAGPFSVTSIGADGSCLLAEDNTTITWSVAKTDLPPVNCANVDIWLSLDGGLTFPILLAGNTPNDGSQMVAIPANAITAQGRIMVIGANNIFFDINDNNIRIDCPINRIVTDNPASGTYKVRQKLSTQGNVVVLPFTSANFYAGESIQLNPGFWAKKSSDFKARIQPCDPCVANKPSALANTDNPRVSFYPIPVDERTQSVSTSPLKVLAYPNPFDQNFSIRFELPESGNVEIGLYDLAGRLVQTISNAPMDAGAHLITVQTAALEDGIYNCRIVGGQYQSLIKLVKIN